MKNRLAYAALAAVLLIVLVISISGISAASHTPKSMRINSTTLNFTAVETTTQQQEQGLMNSTVNESTLVLFDFGNADYYNFWMYDTYYNLDILWVKNDRIVYIAENATPCVHVDPSSCTLYSPNAIANYVVEAKAGFAKKYDIKIGSIVNIS